MASLQNVNFLKKWSETGFLILKAHRSKTLHVLSPLQIFQLYLHHHHHRHCNCHCHSESNQMVLFLPWHDKCFGPGGWNCNNMKKIFNIYINFIKPARTLKHINPLISLSGYFAGQSQKYCICTVTFTFTFIRFIRLLWNLAILIIIIIYAKYMKFSTLFNA